jgi:acyl-CoA synthetase (AMP-forming)/AMP-acid ligase II
VQFSSGTTGAPKPVALSRRALAVQARLINALWPDANGSSRDGAGATGDGGATFEATAQRGFSWLPLHHDMGLVGCVLPALERPADLVLLPPEAFVAKPGPVAARHRPRPRHRLAGTELRLRARAAAGAR